MNLLIVFLDVCFNSRLCVRVASHFNESSSKYNFQCKIIQYLLKLEALQIIGDFILSNLFKLRVSIV